MLSAQASHDCTVEGWADQTVDKDTVNGGKEGRIQPVQGQELLLRKQKTPLGECHILWVRCDLSMLSFVTLYRMCGFKDWVWFGAGWLTLQGVWAGSRAHLTHMVARSVVPCT
jgi:hypothetical protein